MKDNKFTAKEFHNLIQSLKDQEVIIKVNDIKIKFSENKYFSDGFCYDEFPKNDNWDDQRTITEEQDYSNESKDIIISLKNQLMQFRNNKVKVTFDEGISITKYFPGSKFTYINNGQLLE